MRQFSTLLAMLTGMLSDPASPPSCKDALGRPVLHGWKYPYHSLSNQLPTNLLHNANICLQRKRRPAESPLSLRLLFWFLLPAFNLRYGLYMKIEEKTAKCISLLASDRNMTQQQTQGEKEKAFRSSGVLHLAYWNWLRP